MTSDRPKRESRNKRRNGRKPRAPSPHRHATAIVRELQLLGRALAERHGLDPDDPFPLKRLVLPLTIDFENGSNGNGDEELARQLVRDFSHHLDEAVQSLSAVRSGHVYCFQCASSECAHSTLDDPADTFKGYTATGKPIWQSFLNLCLERSDPRVDQLYGDKPAVIAVAQTADELRGDRLPSFGRGSIAFNVLGQVVVGLVPRELNEQKATTSRVALTVQLVQTRRDDIGKRLRLNILGMSYDDIAQAASARPRGTADRLRQTLRTTRQRVDGLGRKAAQAAKKHRHFNLEAEVEPVISRLRGDLERLFRPHRARTQHAQKRHLSGNRPTSSALRDVREAGSDSFYFDRERKTIIVIGRRGRAHVFSPAGRHVTSIQLKPGEIDKKNQRRRWRPIRSKELETFRNTIARLGGTKMRDER